ncbi:hypothetical protein R5R35_007240 [Gryllus longicercus]|uniref:COMM domain-containing protein 3 n=1 Tax=Gryllus longicercus TaxID=2509291 RepID=A0AAN9VE59_9ORTH
MNLSDDISQGLKPLGNSSAINDECFMKLLDMCVSVILESEETRRLSQLGNMKLDVLKAAYASLLSVLIEAARHNVDSEVLSSMLAQDHNFSSSRAEKLVKCYVENRTKLQASLSHIGKHPPHIVDANWTLDYCIKDSSLDHVGKLQYLIQIQAETCDESMDFKKITKKIKFVCTVEELQDFVSKLKDAVKHVERLAVV